MRLRVEAQRAKIICRTKVVSVHHGAGRAEAVEASSNGGTTLYEADHVLSSMPLGALIAAMTPPAPAAVRQAAGSLRHRNLLVVALTVPAQAGFPYNWIYLPSGSTMVGRIQNYRSWSEDLVKEGFTALGMEYFLADGEPLWAQDDDQIIAFAVRELVASGLARSADVGEG
jgi:protoporphyrinogen oxidase